MAKTVRACFIRWFAFGTKYHATCTYVYHFGCAAVIIMISVGKNHEYNIFRSFNQQKVRLGGKLVHIEAQQF